MTNKFFSSVDGNHLGIASDLPSRCSRLASLSIVSRQSDLRTLLLCLTLFIIGVGQMWANYSLTFSTGSGDGTSSSTSTTASACLSGGSDYVTGNLATASNVYRAGSAGLKLGTSSGAGNIKMNLSNSGKVYAKKIIVSAKRYNSSKAATVNINGGTAQNVTADFANYSFTINGNITYVQIQSSKYIWVESVRVVDCDAPTAVTKGTITSNSVALTITDASNVGTYEVYYSTSSTVPNDGTTISTTVNTKTPTVTGLNASTTYYLWVRSKCSNTSKSDWCALTGSSFTTASAAPAKTLSSISVQTAPTKKKYVAGEMFDPTGLKITATYSDASKEDISYAAATFTLSPTTSTALTTSNTSVSITYGGKSTSQAINVYNVAMQARDEDGNTIPAGGPEAPSRTGKGITPAADANNYVFKEWSVENAELGSSASTKVNTITNPSNAVTVTAVYHKPIPVSWNKNGSLHATTYTGYNQKPVFPANPSSCDATSNTFYGWATGTWDDPVDNLTGKTVYTSASSMPDVTGTVTYHAVFAKVVAGSDYELITDLANLKAGDAYLGSYINYSGWRYYAATSNSAMTNVSTSGTPLKLSSTTGLQKVTFVETATSGQFQIKNSNNKYLYANGTGSAPSWSDTECAWIFSNKDANNLFKIKSSLGTYYLRAYATSATVGALKMYGSETNSGLCVFQASTSYSKYITSCCTPLVSINGSFNRYHLKIFHHIIMSMFISLIFKC